MSIKNLKLISFSNLRILFKFNLYIFLMLSYLACHKIRILILFQYFQIKPFNECLYIQQIIVHIEWLDLGFILKNNLKNHVDQVNKLILEPLCISIHVIVPLHN